MRQRGVTLAAAVALDLALGELPTRVHPVAAAGWCLRAGHERLRSAPRPLQLAGGALVTAATATAAAGLGCGWARAAAALPSGWPRPLFEAAALKPTFALRALIVEARGVAAALDSGDLLVARRRLRALVSRTTTDLPPGLVASAACESLAENLTDSVVAPWLAFLLLGLPAAAAYRVVNTADAMYGYRGELAWLGRGAALADDWANWLPARLAAVLLVGAAGLIAGPQAGVRAWHGWQQEAERTASPNAGQTMAAMAGALGRRLEKRDAYVLGDGYPDPEAADIRRAIRLVGAAAGLMGLTALALAANRRRAGSAGGLRP